MKKLVFITACTFLTVGAQAQNEGSSDNKMWLGGSAKFNSMLHADSDYNTNYLGVNKDFNDTRWSVGPQFGYLLNKKLAV